jgi:hypothetical protein
MKFYESHFEDYYQSVEAYNLHDELLVEYENFPKQLENFSNLIIYGASGVGKYSQMLYLLKNYSPSLLKYEKKITANMEKQSYTYKMSDVHYEIDMALLGCNSKIMWHEIFQQIVDIVCIKPSKHGIIVCKNFHAIHNELLEIFNSYIQQYSGVHDQIVDSIKIKFILMTEHLSFLPNNIVENCYVLSLKRPSKDKLISGIGIRNENIEKASDVFENLKSENLLNAKEIYSFAMIRSSDELPKDNFNIICDGIIGEMINHKKIYANMITNKTEIDIGKFRDQIYDILIYNLDACDCVWYIFNHFIQDNKFDIDKIDMLMGHLYTFLKQYGNNYRAIFHIEKILFSMICSFVVK